MPDMYKREYGKWCNSHVIYPTEVLQHRSLIKLTYLTAEQQIM